MYQESSQLSNAKRPTIDAQLRKYRSYSRYIHILLYMGGTSHYSTSSQKWSYCKSVVIIFVSFTQALLLLNSASSRVVNIKITIKYVAMAISFLAPAITAICFLLKRKELKWLHDTLHNFFETEVVEHCEIRKKILSSLWLFDKLSYTYTALVMAGSFLYMLFPIYTMIYQLIHNIQPKRYILPFPELEFPWNVPSSGYLYYIHFLYCSSILWALLCCTAAGDIQFGLFALQISSLLQAISFKLKNSLPEDLPHFLKACIEKHQILLKCIYNLQTIYGIILFRMIIVNAIILCGYVIEMMQFRKMGARKTGINIFYMLTKLVQTFLYASYADAIKIESENFRQAVYMSKWIDTKLDKEIKTKIVFMMMQKPMTLSALKIFSIDMNIFTKIMNTAISYYFLVQTLDAVD